MEKQRLYWLLSLIISTAASASENCANLKNQLDRFDASQGVEAALEVFANLKQSCSEQEINDYQYLLADIVAKEANQFVNLDRLADAEALLAKVPTLSWTSISVRGEIAAKRKHWREASQHFRQAYALLVEHGKTKPIPNQPEYETQLQQAATEANLIYGKLEAETTRGSTQEDPIFGNRGIEVKSVALPVHFATGKADLDVDGINSAEQIAVFLSDQKEVKKIVLAGFSDPRGSAAKNLKLSEQRAENVAAFLKGRDINTSIQAIGKGEQPPPRSLFKNLTRDEEYQLWRRVEFQLLR
jgi:outer membrane protein OmpA-like peptidoglycan-associated protein